MGRFFLPAKRHVLQKNSSLWSFHPTNIKYLRLTAINSTGLLFTNTFRSFSRGIKQEFRDSRARPLSLLLSNFPVRPSSLSPLMIEAPRPVSEGRERERRGRRRSSARPKGTSNIILLRGVSLGLKRCVCLSSSMAWVGGGSKLASSLIRWRGKSAHAPKIIFPSSSLSVCLRLASSLIWWRNFPPLAAAQANQRFKPTGTRGT